MGRTFANGPLRWVAPEVAYSDGDFRSVGAEIVALLKATAATSARHRCRLCFHARPESDQHEMLIAMHSSCYVRPHRHFGKVETLMVAEGEADVLIFDDVGNVKEIIPMTPAGAGGHFFYRMPPGTFHTLYFRSEWFVFVETTIGPFDIAKSEAATWAPPESDLVAGHSFLSACIPTSKSP